MGIYEFSAPYLLCTSDCETISIGKLLSFEEGAEEGLMDLGLGYTEARGGKVVRKEISGLYETIDPDDVITFAGAEEGIFIFMNAVLSAGDHVIVQFPAYQSLYEIARAIGCEVTLWEMHEENDWRPDPKLLLESIRDNTRAIIINSPHNPTGFNFSSGELDTIVRVAEEHDLYLFSDEVYRQLEFEPGSRLPAVADLYDKGFSLGVMSKAFGLAGLRYGWIASKDHGALEKISSLKDYTTICSSGPSEYLTAVALRHADLLVERNLGIIQKNLALINSFMERHSGTFEWVRPSAGSIGFVKLKTSEPAEAFCKRVVERSGVLLLPSTVYKFGDSHFRIGFGREDMAESLQRFERFLEQDMKE